VKTPLVTIHGIGGACWGGFRADLPWFLPGYGGTPMLAETSFAGWAQALRAAMDAAGIERADILGHSIGGMVAQEFALTFPERLRRLVLYATTPAFGGNDPGFARQFLADRLSPLQAGVSMADLARQSMTAMLGPTASPAALAEVITAMASTPPEAYRTTVTCLTTFDRRADLPRIAAPTLLLAGERDPLAPPRTMQRMAEAMPDAHLVVLPGAGHLAHLEVPVTFAAAVHAFLDESHV
jgi:pimeloyl-ACP methyl ester carboxylesterase